MSCLAPAVGPYCKPCARSFPSIVKTVSSLGLIGERAVKLNDVNGKVSGLGFPASKEISPGVSSKGNRLRTYDGDISVNRIGK